MKQDQIDRPGMGGETFTIKLDKEDGIYGGSDVIPDIYYKLRLKLDAIRLAEELEKTGKIVKLTLNLKEDHLFKEVYYAETWEPNGELKIEVWPVKEGILGRKDGYIQWYNYPMNLDLMKIRRELIEEYEKELFENAHRWTTCAVIDDHDSDIRTIILNK